MKRLIPAALLLMFAASAATCGTSLFPKPGGYFDFEVYGKYPVILMLGCEPQCFESDFKDGFLLGDYGETHLYMDGNEGGETVVITMEIEGAGEDPLHARPVTYVLDSYSGFEEVVVPFGEGADFPPIMFYGTVRMYIELQGEG